MTGSMAIAPSGSAHHQPNTRFSPTPTSSANERDAQTHVSTASAHSLDGDVHREEEEGAGDHVKCLALGLAALLVGRVCARLAEAPEKCRRGHDLDAAVHAEADEGDAPGGETGCDGNRGLQDVPRDREPLEPDSSTMELLQASKGGRFHDAILPVGAPLTRNASCINNF